MRKTIAVQAFLTILMSKNKCEKNSRKWESRQQKWETLFLIRDLGCAVSLETGFGGRRDDAGHPRRNVVPIENQIRAYRWCDELCAKVGDGMKG
jgi:hypothetical protein